MRGRELGTVQISQKSCSLQQDGTREEGEDESMPGLQEKAIVTNRAEETPDENVLFQYDRSTAEM